MQVLASVPETHYYGAPPARVLATHYYGAHPGLAHLVTSILPVLAVLGAAGAALALALLLPALRRRGQQPG